MTLVPVIDEMACVAHGDCAVEAPEVFRLEDVAVVVGSGASDVVLAAARGCPAAAISIVDKATGEQLFP